MAKKQINRRKAAKEFAEKWCGRGDEKQDTQAFWTSLLRDVFGVANPEDSIQFEKRIKLGHTSFIDAYIPSTKVLIEQKSIDVDLLKPAKQSDGTFLTPYQQADRYRKEQNYSEAARWIVTCNFKEFFIYDMDRRGSEPEHILLKDLDKDFELLQFLADQRSADISREEKISLKAGELVGKLYDALYKEYINPDENSLRSLNILCVRIVFCLYAEDAGLFETRTAFEDYIKSFSVENLRDGIIKLFKVLDIKPENRDKYDTKINSFPYVNGGLFAADDIEIPNFTKEIVDVIVNFCAPFDWSEISPTIFGAVFESTLNPETRRKGGMHYTSIENIHKVIDPLFLDDLRSEFAALCKKTGKEKTRKLEEFRAKLANLKFLDPACGSGNFLTETYISLRRLENECLKVVHGDQMFFGHDLSPIKVKISQFYGIEINDFAVTVAKTALWIAESQMMKETEEIVNENIDFLPLSTSATIVEGNALRMDWSTLSAEKSDTFVYADKLNVYAVGEPKPKYGEHYKELNVVAKEVEEKELPENIRDHVVYDYIFGNPPFIGARYMGKGQKEDVISIFGRDWRGVGDLDYVCCWYKKAADVIQGSKTRCAFVSTNSVSQGASIANLWKPLFSEGLHFDFAWRTFKWANETSDKKNMAAVHCVIIGFSVADNTKPKIIFVNENEKTEAKNINGYLLDAPDIFIEKRTLPLCSVPLLLTGSQRIDNDEFIFTEEEKNEFVKTEPLSEKYFRTWYGAEEFLYNCPRWCLYLGNCSPSELRKMKNCMKILEAVKQYRLASKRTATVKAALYPARFGLEVIPTTNFMIIPVVSSEKRLYVPIGFMTPDNLCSNQVNLVPDATLYHFGVLTSSVHNAWMRAVCGRLEMRYRYSKDIVYNNFPWPDSPSKIEGVAAKADGGVCGLLHTPQSLCDSSPKRRGKENKEKIKETAQAILDAREKYPDSSLADLYDETLMPPELRKAHKENDKAVMQAYGFDPKMTEAEIVAELFKMYEKLTKK